MDTTLLPFVREFFEKLGIAITSLDVSGTGDDININIQTPDSALLIGMHGKNVDVFQHLLSRMIERKTHEHIHVHLEINDYMKQKEEKLFRFLDSKISQIMTTGQKIKMPSLTAYERKKAHGYIATKNITGLTTQSEGEGVDRALTLSYSGELKARSNPIDSTPTQNPKNHLDPLLSDEGVGI